MTFASLLIAIVCGACLTTLACYTTVPILSGSVGLLPLILLARIGSVSRGAIGGAAWGLSVAILTATLQQGSRPIEATTAFFCVTIFAPAAYGAVGARITRWIGFSPFVLGVLWYGLACGVAVLGFSLYATHGEVLSERTWYQPTVSVLGHTCLALMISWISATIVLVLDTAVHVDFETARLSHVPDRSAGPLRLLITVPYLRSIILSLVPRAPPFAS